MDNLVFINESGTGQAGYDMFSTTITGGAAADKQLMQKLKQYSNFGKRHPASCRHSMFSSSTEAN